MGERLRVITSEESSHGYAGSHITGEYDVEISEGTTTVEVGKNDKIKIGRDVQKGSLIATHFYRHNREGPWHGTNSVQVGKGHALSLLGRKSARLEKINDSE